jgi:death-on-curing protein
VTDYLSLDDALHVVQRLGFHMRDVGLLSSSLARPETSLGGVDAYPSLDLKAAVLLESLIRNHALLDGNKRLAWTLTIAFLWINGFRHNFVADDAFALVVGVADQSVSFEDAAQVISAHRVAR